jgi:hypothetical protein
LSRRGPPVVTPLTGVKDPRNIKTDPLLIPQFDEVIIGNQVKIEMALPESFHISLGIFNLKGQEVKRLGSEYLNNNQQQGDGS